MYMHRGIRGVEEVRFAIAADQHGGKRECPVQTSAGKLSKAIRRFLSMPKKHDGFFFTMRCLCGTRIYTHDPEGE
jgi:hypothetical protein